MIKVYGEEVAESCGMMIQNGAIIKCNVEKELYWCKNPILSNFCTAAMQKF